MSSSSSSFPPIADARTRLSLDRRAALEEELAKYAELEAELGSSTGRDEPKMLDLGANVYATARVHDPDVVNMYVGLGFYIQCSAERALELARERVQIMAARKTQLDRSIEAMVSSSSEKDVESNRELGRAIDSYVGAGVPGKALELPLL